MNGRLNINFLKERKLHRVLRRHLKDTAVGRRVLSVYASDKEQGKARLIAYLRERLPNDQGLANEIAAALGRSGDQQFMTVVTGGQIGQIINAANIENLHHRIYLFSSTLQLVVFLLIMLPTIAGTAYGVRRAAWLAAQPDMMKGDFNIAVAEFVQTDLNGEAAGSQLAEAVSQRIFSFLDGEYVTSNFDDVEVSHDKIGIIHNGSEAEALAAAINADLVIYGDVTVAGQQVLVSPKFYMSNTYRSGTGEVNGEYRLAAPVNFDAASLLNPSDTALNEMRQKAGILIEFTRSLVYLGTGDLAPAARTIDLTLQTAVNENFEGKEVLYLFASHIARLQGNNVDAQLFIDTALALNGNYGRALIAQANIYYDQSQLDQARIVFEEALALEDQPYGSFVAEKANLGLGNVYTVQFLEVNRNPEAAPAEAIQFANQALGYYQAVVDAFLAEPDNNILVDLSTLAYYGSGIVYQTAGDCKTARTVLEQARSRLGETSLIISDGERLRVEIDTRLGELMSCG